MLLEHIGELDLARALEAAVAETFKQLRTPDLGGTATTAEFTAAVRRHLSWLRFATLMRILCERNGGAFVALNRTYP